MRRPSWRRCSTSSCRARSCPRWMKASPSRRLRLPEGTAIEETARQAARLEAAARGARGPRDLHPGGCRHGRGTGGRRRAGRAGLCPAPVAGARPALRAGRVRRAAAGAAAGSRGGRAGYRSRRPVGVRQPHRARRAADAGRSGRARSTRGGARWADSAPRRASAAIPGLTDVRDAYAGTQPVVELGLERERIALRGSRWTRWPSAMAGGLGGVEASELRETDRRTPIRVRYAGARQRGPRHGARGDHRRACPWVSWSRCARCATRSRWCGWTSGRCRWWRRAVERGGTARAVRAIGQALGRLAAPAGLSWQVGWRRHRAAAHHVGAGRWWRCSRWR